MLKRSNSLPQVIDKKLADVSKPLGVTTTTTTTPGIIDKNLTHPPQLPVAMKKEADVDRAPLFMDPYQRMIKITEIIEIGNNLNAASERSTTTTRLMNGEINNGGMRCLSSSSGSSREAPVVVAAATNPRENRTMRVNVPVTVMNTAATATVATNQHSNPLSRFVETRYNQVVSSRDETSWVNYGLANVEADNKSCLKLPGNY